MSTSGTTNGNRLTLTLSKGEETIFARKPQKPRKAETMFRKEPKVFCGFRVFV